MAPDEIATYVHPSILFSFMYFTIPAIARAPAGSSTHRVSLNPILIAAQISSTTVIEQFAESYGGNPLKFVGREINLSNI